MPRILVVYGTTDGHTAKIAHVLAATLQAEGCGVDLRTGSQLDDALQPERYDGVIVAASVHAGRYQRPVERWIRFHRYELNELPCAFLSVCLAVLQKDEKVQAEIKGIMNRFLLSTGWDPGVRQLVAGALPYTRYGWLKRMIMRRISRKAGGDTDTSRDYEYTDWDDIKATARAFAQLGHPVQAEAPARGSRRNVTVSI